MVSPPPPRAHCNQTDARNFVVIARRCGLSVEAFRSWLLASLSRSVHVAAFDTYNRTQSAWRVRVYREDPTEVRALVRLSWQGRRFMDSAALTFVSSTPRPPPVMNAAEILCLMLSSVDCMPLCDELGVSGVDARTLNELWDEDVPAGNKTTFFIDPSTWMWAPREELTYCTPETAT